MRHRNTPSRYEVDQGFEQHQNHHQKVISIGIDSISSQTIDLNQMNRSKKASSLIKEQAKLRFISIQREKSHSSHYQFLKEQQQKNINKSMTLEKGQQSFLSIKKRSKILKPISKSVMFQSFQNAVIKLKRHEIGQNIMLKQFNLEETKALKDQLISKGASLVFQGNRQSNSHGLLKKFLKQKKDNFLSSKYNGALLQKLNQSFINPKGQLSGKLMNLHNKKGLQFVSDFQSSNLDFVTQVNPFEYDIYLRADTNTLGHQNWFYFKILNHSQEKKTIFINVSNLKRGFKMVKKGQKLYRRQRKIADNTELKTYIEDEDQQWSQWEKIEEQVTVSINLQHQQNKKKVYKLSFSATLAPQIQYQYSLLPPFTYSQMLKEIQNIEKNCKNATVQTLTFSLLGLCLPIVTFEDQNYSNLSKKVILISSRIHPGQACGSSVASGILKKLSQQSAQNSDLLQNYIIKIIPMLNPDGVLLGNFRTNYLGNDLNRSFHNDNQSIYPEVVGIKQLGRKLKQQFKERFLCFIDLHGHSSQKNIFIYGPNYDENHKNYVNSRFFPKTLNLTSQQFDYDKCTFNLEQCKTNTARGFFLSSLKVMSFTIESSYALFDSNKDKSNKNLDLKIKNWFSFGQSIVNSFRTWAKLNQVPNSATSALNTFDIRKQQQQQNQKQSNNQEYVINKIRKQIKKQALLSKKRVKKRKISQNSQQSGSQDSDGQSQSQDISIKQRQKLQKKLIDGNSAHLFPRILRPAIIHPQVTPPAPLISVSKIGSFGGKLNPLNNPIVNGRIKRNRYQNIKPMNVNNAYTQYLLKQVKGLQSLRPSVNLMKLQRKQSFVLNSLNSLIK